jgi:antitoxin (DNA-binding transcriptional repressor) of toxin-antitoxin stability system
MEAMATIQLSDPTTASDLSTLLDRVRQGEEILFQDGDHAVAVLHAPLPLRRSIDESLALMPEHSSAVMDEDFAKDVAEAVAWHREPLDTSRWD